MADFFSQAWPFAAAVLVVLGVVALVFLIIILYRVSVTMKSVQNMAAEAEKEVTPALAKVNPIVDKAELMVDTVNLEMLRVDAILEDVEQVTDVAGKAATTVDTVTSAPAEAVTSLIDRIRGSVSSKRTNKLKAERVVYPIGSGDAPATDDAAAPAAGDADAAAQADTADAPSAQDKDEAMKEAAAEAAAESLLGTDKQPLPHSPEVPSAGSGSSQEGSQTASA